jgi:hypothetical protein
MSAFENDPGPAVGWRLARVMLVLAGVVAAVTIAFSSGAVTMPGVSGGSRKTQASDQATLAAQRTAADKHWASSTCTNILAWKNEIQRDGTSLNLSLGPTTRIHEAITATTRLLSQLDTLGLPPSAQTTRTQAQLNQLRAEIASRLSSLKGAAGSVAGGNFAAIGTLIDDLESAQALPAQIAGELQHVVSVDLGLSVAETRACRQLVGIPI